MGAIGSRSYEHSVRSEVGAATENDPLGSASLGREGREGREGELAKLDDALEQITRKMATRTIESSKQ